MRGQARSYREEREIPEGIPMSESTKQLCDDTRELIDAALRTAAYGEALVRLGSGTKDTMRNLVADLNAKAEAARRTLRMVEGRDL